MYTDHKPLKYIYVQPHLNAHQARWLERLAELDLNIVYKPGVENVAADVCLGMGATCRILMMSALISIALLTCKLHMLFVHG